MLRNDMRIQEAIAKNKSLDEEGNLTEDSLSQDEDNLETMIEAENSRKHLTESNYKNTAS
ncbi:11800_t:CDS:2, partial [Cetraspora pellucida]